MADRYWIGGTGNWDASTTTNWSASSGGAGGASVPTSSDNVIFDSLSNATAYTITITATANCLDFTMAGPLVGAVTWAGSSALNIFGSMNLSGGTAGITKTYSGNITFSATTTGKTITTNGVGMAVSNSTTTFNGVGGGWTLQDTYTSTAGTFTITAGALDTNGQTVNSGSFVSNNSNTRSITLGNSTINCLQWNLLTITGLTFSSGTSSIISGPTNNAPISGAVTYNNFKYITNGNSVVITSLSGTFNGTLEFANNPGGANNQAISFGQNITVAGTLAITGATTTNRVLVKSDTLGTARTITAAAISVDKADFQDITGAGAASWDMSAAAGYTGDCGGNSMKALGSAAFTTAATCNWSAGTTWSTATWSNHSIPLPQDTATFTTAGVATITQDMPRIGSVDFTGSANKTWTTSTVCSVFGSINLTNLATLTTSSQTYTFEGRGSNTLNSAGLTWAKQFNTRMVGGTITFNSNFVSTAGFGISMETGTLTANGYNYTAPTFTMNNVGTKTLNMGTGTWELNGTGTVWTLFATGLTINPSTSTIKCTNNSASNITFNGGGFTYNNIWFSRGTATGTITIVGSNTFADFKDDGSVAHSILFTAGTTQTVTTFTVNGTAGNLITLNSTTTATHALVKSGGGTITCDYLNIQHSVATPSSTWYAGTNSTDNQAVATAGSGWIFTAPPGGISTGGLLMFF